jgi:transposase-like protein
MIAREQLQELFTGGVGRGSNIVSALVETVTRLVVQELLEGEQAEFLGGRGRYERRGEGQSGSRNGYEPGRVRTAEGAIEVAVPQVRGAGEPFRSSLMSFLDGNSEVLERLVTEMYARGLSTRDVEDAFRDATGEVLLSKSAVSEITDRLWEDYQQFVARDLSDIAVEYLFVDAVFESLRRHGAKEAVLVCWCIASDGRKHLLHLAVGNKESQACWSEFFSQHAGPWHASTHHHHLRRCARADQRHHDVFPGEHSHPVLVSPAGQPPCQAARRDRR